MNKFVQLGIVMLVFVPMLSLMESGFKIDFKDVAGWKVLLYKLAWMLYGAFVASINIF